MTNFTRSLLLLAVLLAPPAAALPQDSSIFGQVIATDVGALPGVTVEVTSPALVEQPDIAVTDAQGRYDIGNLRPGAYTLTFRLPGFGTVVRSDVEVGDEPLSVNATPQVGSLTNVTLSGQVPLPLATPHFRLAPAGPGIIQLCGTLPNNTRGPTHNRADGS